MKKIFLLTVLSLAIHSNGAGQSEKKDLKLTVSALPLLGSSDEFESGINGIAIRPSIGYFITEKTAIDINFSYASLSNLTVGNVDSYYTSYAFVPTLRNNFVNKAKARVFAEIGFGLGTITYGADTASLRNSQHEDLSGGISILTIGLGGNYFFNEKFGLELIVPYLGVRNITSENSNNLYTGVGPTLGVTYVVN